MCFGWTSRTPRLSRLNSWSFKTTIWTQRKEPELEMMLLSTRTLSFRKNLTLRSGSKSYSLLASCLKYFSWSSILCLTMTRSTLSTSWTCWAPRMPMFQFIIILVTSCSLSCLWESTSSLELSLTSVSTRTLTPERSALTTDSKAILLFAWKLSSERALVLLFSSLLYSLSCGSHISSESSKSTYLLCLKNSRIYY